MPLTVVVDPGHGGTREVGGSSPNNALSCSGILEKDLTLDLAKRIRRSLEEGAVAAHAAALGKSVELLLTRDSDVNLGLVERARFARDRSASVFLSLHFNCFDGALRGTEAWIDRKYEGEFRVPQLGGGKRVREGPGDPTSAIRNINHVDDALFGAAVVRSVVDTLKVFDPEAHARSTWYSARHHGENFRPPEGVRMRDLQVLRDSILGAPTGNCRACLLLIEFIDHPEVDALINGPKGEGVQNRLADAIGRVLVDFA